MIFGEIWPSESHHIINDIITNYELRTPRKWIYMRTRRSLAQIILEKAPKSDFEAKFQANQGMYG